MAGRPDGDGGGGVLPAGGGGLLPAPPPSLDQPAWLAGWKPVQAGLGWG